MSVWQLDALSVTASDGRALEVVLGGPPDGIPLIFFHGTPGAAGPFDRLIETGAERGMRHSRTRDPDIAAPIGSRVARWLRAWRMWSRSPMRLGTTASTARGIRWRPHSIACAAPCPERVIAVAAISTPAPIDAEGFDWLAGMGADNIEEFGAARSGDPALREYLEREATAVNGVSPDQLLPCGGSVLRGRPPCRHRRVRRAHGATDRASLSSGIWGWHDDDLALVSDWGFELDQRRRPAPRLAWR